MIKYAEIEGYINRGEIGLYTHLYQFVEAAKENPVMILIHGYEVSPAKVFKGLISRETLTYLNIPLTINEEEVLIDHLGHIEQVSLLDMACSHKLLRDFTNTNGWREVTSVYYDSVQED